MCIRDRTIPVDGICFYLLWSWFAFCIPLFWILSVSGVFRWIQVWSIVIILHKNLVGFAYRLPNNLLKYAFDIVFVQVWANVHAYSAQLSHTNYHVRYCAQIHLICQQYLLTHSVPILGLQNAFVDFSSIDSGIVISLGYHCVDLQLWFFNSFYNQQSSA